MSVYIPDNKGPVGPNSAVQQKYSPKYDKDTTTRNTSTCGNFEYDFLFFITRAQPLHIGHVRVIQEALQRARRVIIGIGSANSPRTFRNPFTFDERYTMIKNSFSAEDAERIECVPIADFPYNDVAWIKNVHQQVKNVTWNYRAGIEQRIGLIGYAKDHTSYYLNLFPDWGNINVEQKVIYNATDVREAYFTSNPQISDLVVAPGAINFMKEFLETPDFKYIVDEWNYIKGYRKSWADAKTPHPVSFQTADALVTHGAHVLLIKRKAAPGKGLWAMPGGFLEVPKHETLFQAALREAWEETNLDIPEAAMRGSLVSEKTFDAPHRSERGRIITQVFHFCLNTEMKRPKVRAGSDAGKAEWKLITDLDPKDFFEDHYYIIMDRLKLEKATP